MPDMDTFNEIDAELDAAFGVDSDNDSVNDVESDIDEEVTQTIEGQETLEDLMQSNETKKTKEDNSFDKTSNITKPNEQSANKSKRTNNSQDLVDANGNIVAKAGAERIVAVSDVLLPDDTTQAVNQLTTEFLKAKNQ